MAQQHNAQKIYTEANVYIAISDLDSNQIQSERHAAATYSVPRTTIQRRRARQRSLSDWEPPAKRLTKLEEEAIT